LLAWTNPNGHPYLNEEFMKAYLGMGDLVHVYRGSRIQAGRDRGRHAVMPGEEQGQAAGNK